MNQNIERAINEAIDKGTFTLQAVEGIKELRSDLNNAKADVIRLEGLAKSHQDKYTDELKEHAQTHGELTKMKVRLENIDKREKDADVLWADKRVAEAEANAYHNCLELICKNTVVKKTLMGQIPVASGDYGATQPISTDEETREE